MLWHLLDILPVLFQWKSHYVKYPEHELIYISFYIAQSKIMVR